MDKIPGEKDEIIEPEKLMKKIKENVHKRKEKGIFGTLSIDNRVFPFDQYSSSPDIGYITGKSHIGNYSYLIRSHHKYFGMFLVKGREMIHGEVKRYVDPIFLQQSEWNAATARIINEHERQLLNILDQIRQIETNIESHIRIGSTEYPKPKGLTEEEFKTNTLFHGPFINLIHTYALRSAGDNIPKVAEIGLGTGTISLFLSRDCHFDIFGIDKSIHHIFSNFSNNVNLGGSVKYMQLEPSDFSPLKDNFFDVAFSEIPLVYSDDEAIVKYFLNQLQIAHYCVFLFHCGQIPSHEFHHEQEMSLNNLRMLLEDSGFNILHLEYYHDNMNIIGVLGQ